MGDRVIEGVLSVVTLIVGVAALSALISRNAQTSNVVRALSGGLATDIYAATSPVTGYTGSGGGAMMLPGMSNMTGGG
jgi:membrane DNA delivery protein